MNPLTWQNPEQLFVAQVLKKIFYNSVAELRDSTKVYVKYLYGQPNSDTYLKMKYETDHRISIYLTSDNSLGDRTIVRELIVRDSMYDMATQDDEITGLTDCTIVQ